MFRWLEEPPCCFIFTRGGTFGFCCQHPVWPCPPPPLCCPLNRTQLWPPATPLRVRLHFLYFSWQHAHYITLQHGRNGSGRSASRPGLHVRIRIRILVHVHVHVLENERARQTDRRGFSDDSHFGHLLFAHFYSSASASVSVKWVFECWAYSWPVDSSGMDAGCSVTTK